MAATPAFWTIGAWMAYFTCCDRLRVVIRIASSDRRSTVSKRLAYFFLIEKTLWGSQD